MINKRVSKISMLMSLLVATMVNAQEFYTCVPKKSWWKDIMTESVEKGIKKTKSISKWRLVWERYIDDIRYDENISLNLSPGKYKIVLSNRNDEPVKEFELLGNDNISMHVTWNASIVRIHILIMGLYWNANKPEIIYLYKYE